MLMVLVVAIDLTPHISQLHCSALCIPPSPKKEDSFPRFFYPDRVHDFEIIQGKANVYRAKM